MLDDAAKHYGHNTDIKNWVSVNLVVSISLTEWRSLNYWERTCIVNEVNEIVRKRESEINEQKQKMMQREAEAKNKMNFLDTSNASFKRAFR